MTSELILLTTAAAVSTLLAGGAYVALRRKRAQKSATKAEKAVLANVAEEQAKIGATIEAIATEIKDMRSDIQWLTSERMIDQAINMAREGESGSEIARQTGISADELVAMQAFRRH
ncbi:MULTISPECIES: hypothetical protein [Donghicola]|uniref:DUF2802 domain-containing protein n=1 Tax=Donghicola eburneus TaxID=393278 RepID=A0A1M4N4T5_9RHOB|nr:MULTISPECIES: hypothetical protein [Donghicola]MCI5041960.1 hypothetical protein [Donghicola eburneus]MCT4579031.1 hypothetical protein [Donghicola sp.]SCM69087.1 hypothetical protein KARMA_3320 [Donghicola eburneus]SFQ36326.1 hypothetical protein SAMN05421764_103134 [Donghicola eburneus]